MIRLEGYKAFRGTMRITPTIPDKEPFELTGDWLYKPEDKCWYGLCRSFPDNICTVVIDLTCAPSLLNVSRPPLTGPGDNGIEIVKPTKGNTDTRLEKCPFCGSEEIVYEKYQTKAGERWRCWCSGCIACIDPGYAQDRWTVQAMWNRRTPLLNESGDHGAKR